MVRSKSVYKKQQSQQQDPDDEGDDDLNIADDVITQQQSQQKDKHRSIPIMKKPRKKRGINKIKDLPAGESVRFNKVGAAIGEYQRTFTSYCGNSVRKNISILYPNWHKVDEKDKDLLWLDIKKIREEARARALNQTNRPRVGAKGFAGFEEQWEEERNDPNRATDLHKIPGRGSNFVWARDSLIKMGT